MSTRITIDSEQVLGIAGQIEADNQQPQQLLEDSKATLNNLASTWTGGAAEQTRSSYETFAGKYFQTYFDVLEQYVKFLRTNVAEQYTEVENLNTQLGDAFK
jgi:WXG100 family type VII secretion target